MRYTTGKLALALTAFVLTVTLSASQAQAAEEIWNGDTRHSNLVYPTALAFTDDATLVNSDAALNSKTVTRLLHREKQGKWSLSSFSKTFEALGFQEDVLGLQLQLKL